MTRIRKTLRYFTDITEQAVLDYISADSQYIKNKIYREFLHEPLMKLTEVLINSGSYSYALQAADPDGTTKSRVVALQYQSICHLLNILHNYNSNSGKAYSYFTVVTTYYLINTNKAEYKKLKEQDEVDSIEYLEREGRYGNNIERDSDFKDFISTYIDYFENNIIYYFPKKRDYAIANAFLEILKRSDVIPDFQKKKIYLLIREQTNCKQPDITAIFNKIKKISLVAHNEYFTSGTLDKDKIYKLTI